ncbi:MAG: Coq4 family protein [Erythrobacter sp.]
MSGIDTVKSFDSAGSARLPFWHPERKPYKRNLRKAWHHFFEFKKDKEDTSEVFKFFHHLPWIDVDKRVAAFLSTEKGQHVLETEPFLPEILDDHEMLRRDYPKGSLAHAYCDYMEQEGLSAAGLVAEFEEFRFEDGRPNDQIEWYNDRLRDTHDLLHLLSGIGRDTLGEATLGAYVFGQRPSHGHLILGIAGSLVMKRSVKTKAPVLRAIWNAKAAGKDCLPIAEQSIRELLAMTPDEARAHLNMQPARAYEECQRIWTEEEGIDPLAILAKEDPSAGTKPQKA